MNSSFFFISSCCNSSFSLHHPAAKQLERQGIAVILSLKQMLSLLYTSFFFPPFLPLLSISWPSRCFQDQLPNQTRLKKQRFSCLPNFHVDVTTILEANMAFTIEDVLDILKKRIKFMFFVIVCRIMVDNTDGVYVYHVCLCTYCCKQVTFY